MVSDLSFSEISLSDFVDPEEAKSHLKESEKLLSQGNTEASIDQASIAFRILLEDYEGKKSVRYGRSPFFFGQDLTFLDSFYMDLGYNGKGLVATPQFQEKLGDFIDKVKESLEAIQNAIRILAMGIDYPRYSRFDLLTPQVLKSREGEHIVEREYRGPRIQGDEEDAQFCINFVIETALKLQEFDYSINKKKNDDPLTPH
jgi:hypothetical protein